MAITLASRRLDIRHRSVPIIIAADRVVGEIALTADGAVQRQITRRNVTALRFSRDSNRVHERARPSIVARQPVVRPGYWKKPQHWQGLT